MLENPVQFKGSDPFGFQILRPACDVDSHSVRLALDKKNRLLSSSHPV